MTLVEFIVKQDEALAKKNPYSSNDLADLFYKLMAFSRVEVGWRESCGYTDLTVHTKRGWDKVIKQARKTGFAINEERVKHNNKSPTTAGGFWHSIIYTLPSNASSGGAS